MTLSSSHLLDVYRKVLSEQQLSLISHKKEIKLSIIEKNKILCFFKFSIYLSFSFSFLETSILLYENTGLFELSEDNWPIIIFHSFCQNIF